MAADSPKLKIGLVLDSSLDLEDGVQQYVMTMGEWLRAGGHDVHYLVGQTEQRQLPGIHSLSRNAVVKFNGNRINLPLWGHKKKIQQLFAEHSFDVLYVQTPFHPLMAQRVVLAAPQKTAIIGSFNILPHSRFVATMNRALRVFVQPALKRFDQMLAVSPAAARYEEHVFGLPAEVSPNVFRYSVFHEAKPLDHNQQADTKTILFLGRLVPRKGCQTLLEATTILKSDSEIPNFRVVVCGKGPLENSLKQYVNDHDLRDAVEFVGFVADGDKPRYYASADIAVFPSDGGESFGIVLLEAMANGRTAVLAGDNPGYRSVMEPQPDLIFPARDAAQLASIIKQQLLNDKLRQQYAMWGADYTKQFDVNVVGKELETLFYRLCERKKLQ